MDSLSPSPARVTTLATAAVATVLAAVALVSLGPAAAIAAAVLVGFGALIGHVRVALAPLLIAGALVLVLLTGSEPSSGEEDWTGLIAFLIVLAGAGAAFCLGLGAAIARIARSHAH